MSEIVLEYSLTSHRMIFLNFDFFSIGWLILFKLEAKPTFLKFSKDLRAAVRQHFVVHQTWEKVALTPLIGGDAGEK